AALHRLEQFGKVAMTIVEAGAGIGDAHHGFAKQFARIAHGLRKGAAQIKREVAVTIIGESVLEAHLASGHRLRPCPAPLQRKRRITRCATRIKTIWPSNAPDFVPESAIAEGS